MAMLSLVTCPKCEQQFPVTVADFKDNPESKYCACIRCHAEFGVLDGKPFPPLGDTEYRK